MRCNNAITDPGTVYPFPPRGFAKRGQLNTSNKEYYEVYCYAKFVAFSGLGRLERPCKQACSTRSV